MVTVVRCMECMGGFGFFDSGEIPITKIASFSKLITKITSFSKSQLKTMNSTQYNKQLFHISYVHIVLTTLAYVIRLMMSLTMESYRCS